MHLGAVTPDESAQLVSPVLAGMGFLETISPLTPRKEAACPARTREILDLLVNGGEFHSTGLRQLRTVPGLMGEPARAAILVALVGGRALPAGELAFISNVAPQTASFHLRKLADAFLITVEKKGKHSYYRLASERVAATLESIAALAPVRGSVDLRIRARREPEHARELRFARSCYRHLAGLLAVEIHQALLDRALLVARATERRRHIGGALGAALFFRLTELNWIVRKAETRAVRVTHRGAGELEQQLGIVVSRMVR